jgi:hypothetical protein
MVLLDGLDLHTDRLLPQQVHAKPLVELEAIEFDRNRNLAANAKAALSKLVSQHDFVHCFQQAFGTWLRLVEARQKYPNRRPLLLPRHAEDAVSQASKRHA